MAGLDLKAAQWEQQHRAHVEEYLRQIDALYDAASEELVRLGIGYNYQPETGRLFTFSSNKSRRKQADASLSSFRDKLSTIITAGIATEWAFANDKNDSWVKQLSDNPKKEWMLHNLDALEAFQQRMTYGHTLSERVWSIAKQFERHVELSLSVGISEGRSAANISRDARMYLNEPDKLFRRVRDAFGNLTLSKAAQAYHPGQGVYRSSYQNAMRMARTEINSAYREADSIRWQQLDFIVGYEVKTSKSHAAWLAKAWYPRFKKGRAPLEICDAMEGKYPKSFKFIGWHPNCRCYAVPIIANEDTGKDWWEDAENEVADVPPRFKEWLIQNADRIEKANNRGTLPYWITENKQYTDISDYKKNRRKEILIEAKTQNNRILHNPQFSHDIHLTNHGIKEWLNQPHESYYTKNESLLDIKRIVEESVYCGSGQDYHDTHVIAHLFETKIGNTKSWIVVREYPNGEINLHSVSDSKNILNILQRK